MPEVRRLLNDFYAKIRGDLVFAVILLACLLCSLMLRRFFARVKSLFGGYRALDGAVGFLLALAATRSMILCSLLVVVAHIILYQNVRNPALLTKLSFFGTFAYLALLRMMHFVGLPPLVHIANGIQLLMTLRAIGLTYEIADARITKLTREESEKDARDLEKVLPKRTIFEPTSLQAFSYLYGFVGLFTGPYYTYQTFVDSERFGQLTTECLRRLVREKTSKLYWSLPLLLAFSWLDPVDALRGEKINTYSKLSLVLWSALAFVYFRMRIYTAWMVSESICITAGIGVYPTGMEPRPGSGPSERSFSCWLRQDTELKSNLIGDVFPEALSGKDLSKTLNDVSPGGDSSSTAGRSASSSRNRTCDCSSETISNLDIAKIEHSDGFRSGMRAWNRTVQFWLANFVYKRTHRSIRMPCTMLVSAFWHGIHPGYFLSFLTIPLCTTAEDLLFEIFPEERRPFWISVTWSFIRMRGFESMACGFLLLTWSDTIRLWTNLYLWLHFTTIAVIVASKVYLTFFRSRRRPNEGNTEVPMNTDRTEQLHHSKND